MLDLISGAFLSDGNVKATEEFTVVVAVAAQEASTVFIFASCSAFVGDFLASFTGSVNFELKVVGILGVEIAPVAHIGIDGLLALLSGEFQLLHFFDALGVHHFLAALFFAFVECLLVVFVNGFVTFVTTGETFATLSLTSFVKNIFTSFFTAAGQGCFGVTAVVASVRVGGHG